MWIVGRASLARFPQAPELPLGEDVPGIRSFVIQSSLATGMVSARTTLAPLILGLVAGPTQVGLLRIAQAPQSGFAAASSPVRLILLTEQTRDWEHGHEEHRVFDGLRRYMAGAVLVAVVSVPIFLLAMPWLVEVVFGEEYLGAVTAARIVLDRRRDPARARLDEVAPDDDRSTAAERRCRTASRRVVLLPLTALLGAEWGVTGAAWAILASTVAYALVWVVLLRRLLRDHALVLAAEEVAVT